MLRAATCCDGMAVRQMWREGDLLWRLDEDGQPCRLDVPDGFRTESDSLDMDEVACVPNWRDNGSTDSADMAAASPPAQQGQLRRRRQPLHHQLVPGSLLQAQEPNRSLASEAQGDTPMFPVAMQSTVAPKSCRRCALLTAHHRLLALLLSNQRSALDWQRVSWTQHRLLAHGI